MCVNIVTIPEADLSSREYFGNQLYSGSCVRTDNGVELLRSVHNN